MFLLRHGQSAFNAAFTRTRRDPGIPDPRLTELGQRQAEQAAEILARERITRIVVSPYTRALQTATPLARLLRLSLIVDPMVRERYAFSCDIGTPRTELALAWPEVDFSHIDEIWWPAIEEPEADVQGRAAVFRATMAATDEWRTTAVVSHWGFILSVTGESLANGQWIRCDPTTAVPADIVWEP